MDIVYQRLFNQGIEGQRFTTPEEVVAQLGAVQAQDYHQALWAIGLRLRSATVATVEHAIEERTILRTWPMRGTIHFVRAEDAKWMSLLSALRIVPRDTRRMEQLELDDAILARCRSLLTAALSGGKRLSRPDIMLLLEHAGISTKGQRGYHILWRLSLAGLICQGPLQSKQQTFVLLDEWVVRSREVTHEEALAELAKRYFIGHGPATVHDFAWWGGLTITDARIGLAAVKSGLCGEKRNDREYWLSRDVIDQSLRAPPQVHLLAGFDEYLLGYGDRSAMLSKEHAEKVVPGNNGVFYPIIIAAGQVIGTWARTRTKQVVTVTLTPFAQHTDLAIHAHDAIKRYSDFVGLALSSVVIH